MRCVQRGGCAADISVRASEKSGRRGLPSPGDKAAPAREGDSGDDSTSDSDYPEAITSHFIDALDVDAFCAEWPFNEMSREEVVAQLAEFHLELVNQEDSRATRSRQRNRNRNRRGRTDLDREHGDEPRRAGDAPLQAEDKQHADEGFQQAEDEPRQAEDERQTGIAAVSAVDAATGETTSTATASASVAAADETASEGGRMDCREASSCDHAAVAWLACVQGQGRARCRVQGHGDDQSHASGVRAKQ